MATLSYQLASWPDEEILVGEVLLDGEHVASVFRRGDKFEVTVYRQESEDLSLDLDELQNLLTEIRGRLLR